jgi:predicted RNA-binding protein YlqC (UPF0109 family)
MKELVETIARALVDHPDDVQVNSVDGSQVTVLELRVHPEDLGKVIGRQGRTAKAIRTLLGASGMKLHKRFTLEILEDWPLCGRAYNWLLRSLIYIWAPKLHAVSLSPASFAPAAIRAKSPPNSSRTFPSA